MDAKLDIQEVTKKKYRREFKRMTEEAFNRRSDGSEEFHTVITFEDLANDLYENHKGQKKSTLIIRRATLIYMLKEQEDIDPQDKEAALKLLYDPDYQKKLSASGGEGLANSRKPGRMIPLEHFNLIMTQLMRMGKWGRATQNFLLAGVHSGARPVEWLQAKWINKNAGILRLQTAKVKNINAWNNIPPMLFTDPDDEHELALAIKTDNFSREELDRFEFERRLANAGNISLEEKTELRSNRYKEGVELFRDVKIEPNFIQEVDYHMNAIARFFDTINPEYTNDTMPVEMKRSNYSPPTTDE